MFIRAKKKFYKSEINRKRTLDNIFQQLSFRTLDDFTSLSLRKFKQQQGGKTLLEYHFASDYKKLLQTIYPNYPWDFSEYWQNSHLHFKTLNNQQKFLDSLFFHYQLTSFDDWLTISREKIITRGGKSLLTFYNNNLDELLLSVYPNFPWEFDKRKKIGTLCLLPSQQHFLDHVYTSLHLTCFEDWNFVHNKTIIKFGGRYLFHIYSNNFKNVLSNIYPNYPWSFVDSFLYSPSHFLSIENQREYADQLFFKLMLKLEDFVRITRLKFNLQHKGWGEILSYYNNNPRKALRSIYPNYPWQFPLSRKEFFSIETQRGYVNEFLSSLQLSSPNQLLFVSKRKYLKECKHGERLLKFYNFDMKKLLTSIYPDYHWQFDELKYRPHKDYHKSLEFHSDKLKIIQEKYSIKRKEDWYCLHIIIHQINLFYALGLVHPNIEWKKELFSTKSKKVTQRLLYNNLEKIYHHHLSLENYRHPLLQHRSSHELDIYIPSLSLAFEYQGEHHYNDVAQRGYLELHQIRDKSKEKMADKMQIQLIKIPFWWDRSLPTLYSTINSYFS